MVLVYFFGNERYLRQYFGISGITVTVQAISEQ